MKLLITQSTRTSHHFLSLRSKYSPQHPVLKCLHPPPHTHTHTVCSSLSVREQFQTHKKQQVKVIRIVN